MRDSFIDFNYFIGNLINQMAVVGDEADRTLKLFQCHLQNASRRDVEMAGRFVKEKKVGRSEEHLCKDQPTLLTATQDRDFLFNLISTEKKSAQEGSKLGLAFIRGDGEKFFEDGIFWAEDIELMLSKVGAGHILSQNDLAFFMVENPGQDLEEG